MPPFIFSLIIAWKPDNYMSGLKILFDKSIIYLYDNFL